MGQVTEKALNLMGVMTWRADDPKDVAPLLHGAATWRSTATPLARSSSDNA